MKRRLLVVLLLLAAFGRAPVCNAQLLRPRDVDKLPSTPADKRASYGADPQQFGDLRLPAGAGRHPVAVVIHGGCWLSPFADVRNTAALSSALTAAGVATWNIEYRRVDNPGGGWPGTFQDVSSAVDYLRRLARTYPLDLKRVVIVGHSAGGHLALWAAGRGRLPKGSPLYTPDPLKARGVVNLGGPGNLRSILPAQEQVCGAKPITRLLGGTPEEVPDRYKVASPSEMLPLKVEQVLITGAQDRAVPPKYGQEYEAEARRSGDKVRMVVVENAGHFEVIAPGTAAWPTVEEAVKTLLKMKPIGKR
ncbi:MAG TPA: alpha/beta hydrolase [Pyrinomonadaceae bacterium]|jgi:acetyl esterase/lipase|nr:alpha/beta hydrolase [Pyrinomonadaceae bacterium]